jgi:hypothetical protein
MPSWDDEEITHARPPIITQAELVEYLDLVEAGKRRVAMRRSFQARLDAGARTERGKLSLSSKTYRRAILSWDRLGAILGRREVEHLRGRIGRTEVRHLSVIRKDRTASSRDIG